MNRREALEAAERLGLSTWTAEMVVSGGGTAGPAGLKCVGFASADLALGEGRTWEEAFEHATRLIFSAA